MIDLKIEPKSVVKNNEVLIADLIYKEQEDDNSAFGFIIKDTFYKLNNDCNKWTNIAYDRNKVAYNNIIFITPANQHHYCKFKVGTTLQGIIKFTKDNKQEFFITN